MAITPSRPHRQSSLHGFSLVELSIVVAIMSVVATLGLEVAANFVNRTANSVSRERLKAVDEATAAFFKIYGRLPCPAAIGLAPVPVNNYGLEDCSLSPLGGVTTPSGGVVAGGVPFRTLNLPMIQSLDGFGSKLNYIVTKNLTSAGMGATQFGNAANWAGIEIRTGVLEQPCNNTVKCQKIADPAVGLKTGAAYVLFSTGADQRGGLSARGVALKNCTASIAINDLRVDSQNCVFGSNTIRGFMNVGGAASTIPYNVFYDNRMNAGMNRASYFDDVMVWRPRAQL